MCRYHVLAALALAVAPAWATEANRLPNPSFEQGDQQPEGWKPEGEGTQWQTTGRVGKRSVSVTGTGKSNTYWRGPAPKLEPGRTYRFTFYAKSAGGESGGCVISGPNFANRDYRPGPEWTRYTRVFTPPTGWDDAYVRLGEWHRSDTVLFDDVSITEVLAVHNAKGGMVLGAGEHVQGKRYTFDAALEGEGSNYSQCLSSATAGFNSNRWVFDPGAEVVYKHQVGAAVHRSATVHVEIGYYVAGECRVECSRDGKQWSQVGELNALGGNDFPLPKEAFPAQVVYVRLRSPGKSEVAKDSAPGSFQVHDYKFESELAVEQRDMLGLTKFLDLQTASDDIGVDVASVGDLLPGEGKLVRMAVRNHTDQDMELAVTLTVEAEGRPAQVVSKPKRLGLKAKGERNVSVPYLLREAGAFTMRLVVAGGGKTLYEAVTPFSVPSLYDSSYGYWLGESIDAEWWWCEATYKISRPRSAPDRGTSQPATLYAARGEYEPVQVVLRPKRDMAQAVVEIGSEDKRWAGHTWTHWVAYHYVHRPTDRSACTGWWPDALPECREPIALKAGQNQPVWVLVKVPPDCPAGDHALHLTVRGEGTAPIRVPITVHVYDFAVPKVPHVTSAFGLSVGRIRRYHNLETREEERRVWDLYMQSFREHRIAPYDFAPFDPIHAEFEGAVWEGAGQVVQEFSPQGTSCLKLDDQDPARNVSCSTTYPIPVEPGAAYQVSWWAKTGEPGHRYLVTLTTYDRDGRWIPNHNIDLVREGTTRWRKVQHRVVPTKRSPQAASVRVQLRATRWDDAGGPTGATWYDDVRVVKEGTEQNLVKDPGFEPLQGRIKAKVDFRSWDVQAQKYLDGYGFSSFRLALKGMGGGTFHSRREGRIGPYAQGTPEYRRVFRDYCQQLQSHLAAKGWLDKAYVYWFDEPAPKDYDFVRAGMEEIKRAGPRLPRMLTEEPIEPLLGAVDVWCPVLHNYKPEDCQPRQERGETIWWYVCCGPKAPYPGLFIDHNAIELRMWLWMTWKWNVQGVLVWTSNYWTSSCAYPSPKIQNPWEDPMGYVSGYDRPPGYIGYWGNGDGRFLYPPNRDVAADRRKHIEGPVSSIRWEMLREGLEDYEYFWLLRDAVAHARKAKVDSPALAEAEALLQIPEQIITSQTEFTRDPQPLHAHRRALAQAIERVAKLSAK